METLTKEINKKFDNQFDFLQLLEVSYDTQNALCKVVFLYPENVESLSTEQKSQIEQFLVDYLGLNAKVEVKFKKSYLDEQLIAAFLLEYFKKNNVSVFASATKDNIEVVRELNQINVTLTFEKEICTYIQENNLTEQIKAALEKNFIAKFSVFSKSNEQTIDQSILEKREQNVPVLVQKKVARYEVFEPQKLFGIEINPFPELICDQKVEKTNVILAGEITSLVKKSFVSKRAKNPDELSYYYSFELKDGTGTIGAIHFASKTSQAKLDTLTEGMQVLCIGDLRKNNYGKLTYYYKAMAHCIIAKDEIQKAVEQSKKEQFAFANHYQFVFPKPFVDTQQQNLFFQQEYNDFIMSNTFVVFDVETTGLEPDFAEIIEIGAVKVIKGELTETFQSLVKPAKEIPSVITEITGITNQMVVGAPSISQVLADFALFCKDSVLSGYNVGFDIRFLQKAAANMGFRFENRVEDVMAFARAQLTLGNYTLKNVAKSLNISLKEAHRALNDAIATARALVALNKKV